MRRKVFGQPTLPNMYYRAGDGVLSIPGYTFEKAFRWNDTGSMTMLAEGSSLKDGSHVLAKIAPAQSNGSMCLEREAHILELLAGNKDGTRPTLRMIEFFAIPRDSGDCVVLLMAHPGLNVLGRFLPPSKINDLLLGDISNARPPSSHADVYMTGIEEPDFMEEIGAFDIMDLASFLEFAIQATHCVEIVHRAGVFHREIRANAFHLNAHSGSVRLVHLGNRAVSLENYGSPSTLVLKAYDELEKMKIKEALCYLAPEQTGGIETVHQDHRTDLYSLGILFWTLLVGRGQLPFEGGPLELLHSIVQKRPMPVHEVRRDVPVVLAQIIEKLLSKSPDARYQSAYGLKHDLLECQSRLLVAVTSTTEDSSELIPSFDIAANDRFMEFTMPLALIGREKELETIRNIIRHTSTSFSRHVSASKGLIAISSGGSQDTGGTAFGADRSDSLSSRSEHSNSPGFLNEGSQTQSISRSPTQEMGSVSAAGTSAQNGDILRRTALRTRPQSARVQAVVVVGSPGAGKSSIVLANQAKWRAHGLWGHAKFEKTDSAPFSALLSCLSSVLRQLMVFHTDLHRFVTSLKERLGPQIQNAPLLYQGTPELKDILAMFDIHIEPPKEHLMTAELRARFQTLVQNVFSVIAETRLFALFLDDLHEADDSMFDLVHSLLNSKSRMLMLITLRPDEVIVERVRSMFASRSKPAAWITVDSLPFPAISTLVAKSLHRSREEVASLSNFVYAGSVGNAFGARNILMTLQRQNYIVYDWDKNHWSFNIDDIQNTLNDHPVTDLSGLEFLTSHFRELPEAAKKYLTWAVLFGQTFKFTDVALMMDWEDSSSSGSASEEEEDRWNPHRAVPSVRNADTSNSRGSILGLQLALAEGWISQRARDLCSFSHDRYRQAVLAETENLPPEVRARMSSRIVLMMLHETPIDVYRIAEHAKRCLPILREHPMRNDLLDVLMDAGESAWATGAHELAMQSFNSARSLLPNDPWREFPQRTRMLYSRQAAILTWKGDLNAADVLITDCLQHVEEVDEQASALRLRSRNHWLRGDYGLALDDTLSALKLLGTEVHPSPTQEDAEQMFDVVKNDILAVGFHEILSIPRTTDPRTQLKIALLNDAGTNAYWSTSPYAFSDIIGLTTVKIALQSGMTAGTALGFFWALGAAAESKELYRFSCDLGKLALRIAEMHGSSSEKCRAQVLYCAMVAGYDNVHLRSNIPRLAEAVQFGNGAGDRVWTCFASIHSIVTRVSVCEHLAELAPAAEECLADVELWAPGGEVVGLAQGVVNLVRALAGNTNGGQIATAFDTDTFIESDYIALKTTTSGNIQLFLNWYNSFKVAGLFCLGFPTEAAELGFYVYETRACHPNHRHVRYALFFHCLAMVACIRHGDLEASVRDRYLGQITSNQEYIKKWQSPSPVNTSTWLALIEAEVSSINDGPAAFRLYDIAVKLAVNHDWLNEEGWALYLQGSHFVRCGVEGLGSELQRRGIARQLSWGAQGIANHLSSIVDLHSQYPPKRPIFSSDVAVQTENSGVGASSQSYDNSRPDMSDDSDLRLSSSDLSSILKWSKEISSDINLSAALQRLTEIVTESSGSQNTCVVIAQAGDYMVATSMMPPGPCQVFEHPRPIRSITDPMQRTIIQHTINSKDRISCDDAALDSRFASEARLSVHRSVVCLPIVSNRGQTFGAVYVASRFAFSKDTVTLLTLLCQQASISIANALLFLSVQTGTKENLKMIATQKDALEAARRSREDALKATKIKSNFLASMSHELRTPFSSFYGLLDLLGSTELDPGQSEIVQTAKQSCELLLKIIDSILDYSKLEASALKLEPSGFLVEDCMELLLPMAAKKLDLSFNIEPDVPAWVFADYARIRQVLMNLIGNAVKFTSSGSVQVSCSVEDNFNIPTPDEVKLKFVIQDTGIGLTPSDVELLFTPFQQADNSTTRRFGGTGLGLSISRQLVKLMSGAIGVQSEINVGSLFWFTIPVQIFTSEESLKSIADLEDLRLQLMSPNPPRIIVCSASKATLAMLNTMLSGFQVLLVPSIEHVQHQIQTFSDPSWKLDVIILDDQSEATAGNLARFLQDTKISAVSDTKIIQLYTPTTAVGGQSVFGSNTPGLIKMTKPPRRARILQTLAGLKEWPNAMSPTLAIPKTVPEVASPPRTLYGNVLVAEDNEIAQNLLVKQLSRYHLNVVATSNGKEAIAAWEKHGPGYFSVALFDHHMPICDGVEATKLLRLLETQRKAHISLPIVALSADTQETTKQLCLSAGMNAFLSKPLKKNDLTNLLSMFGTPTGSGPA